jgi:multidrug resistance efflux pump
VSWVFLPDETGRARATPPTPRRAKIKIMRLGARSQPFPETFTGSSRAGYSRDGADGWSAEAVSFWTEIDDPRPCRESGTVASWNRTPQLRRSSHMTRWLSSFSLLTAGLVAGAAEPAAAGTARVERGPFKAVLEAEGVLVPAESADLGFWPLAYSGEIRVVEVAAHGAAVRKGDVLLRIDGEKAEDLVREARWTIRASERQLADARTKRGEFDEEMERDIARAEKDLAFARKALEGHVDVSRPLQKEEQEFSEKSHRYGIEDQEDELAQLGKMYKEDELTEETEEIVLKRAKRNLEQSRKRLEIVERRNRYGDEYSEPLLRETLTNAVRDREKALRDLRRSRETARVLADLEIEKLEHALGAGQKRLGELERDLEAMIFRAPHDGTVLHGGFEEKVAVTPIRKGGVIPANQTVMTVARDTGLLKVRFPLKEKDRYRIEGGFRAVIVPEAIPDARWNGSIEPLNGFPLPDGTWNAHAVFGKEDPRLHPLLKCKVTVVIAEIPSALRVPSAAVFRKDGRALCYVRGTSPFGIIARAVVTGPDDGKHTVIREGLAEGDEVLLAEPPSP